ncbi:two-component sensor histidine kinase [Deinococcus aerolatus]|uniref:histidine kinase n=1 Tax=Deinococcus aerolatus TaxID=522487 RepID=A0ABQ2G6F7_9DEIO|nr:HAMP domain-containing sensor histidine kinase [Deinococcus aerolatus]GGL78016.1 two-component sensor histidine kinase [Deinococcus aerolatus]
MRVRFPRQLTGAARAARKVRPTGGTGQRPGRRRITLRWRLTVFYTALLAVLLTTVAVTTLVIMRNNLITSVNRDLSDIYGRFVQVLPSLGLTPANTVNRDAAGDLRSVRYQFPSYAIQIEQLTFYDLPLLTERLEEAETPAQRESLFDDLNFLRSGSRDSTGIDRDQPITLSDEQLAELIRSPSGQLLIDQNVQEAYLNKPTPMRVLVRLAPLALQPSPLGLPGSNDTLTIVYVGRSLDDIQHTLSDLRTVILLLFLAGLVTAGVGAYLLAGRALQPLGLVQRAAEGIGGQNLTERVPEPETGDEVQALAGALNNMLARLEDSFEAQRRFTSDASHELRTPVTAISGHASYLLRRTSPNEQQKESLKIIRSESERLTNLIASLLQLARSDSGALVMARDPILSGLFLEEIVRELMPLAQAQRTALMVAGQEVTFEGDADRLKQVIINLVSNALKAGARTITLSSRPEEDGTEVRLSVQDDGPGIPEDQLDRLFDRFYRLEDSRSRDVGGAGLGLSIARGIVEAHGGRIWLESKVGQGTAAHVQLPIGDVPVLHDDDVP